MADRWVPPVLRNAPESAPATSTPWSMTTHDWPTARPFPMKGHLRWISGPRSRLLRLPWHRPHSRRHDRQPLQLCQVPPHARRLRRAERQTPLHQASLPMANRQVERFNRTLQTEWAYPRVFLANTDCATALAPWLECHNTERRHTALGGLPPPTSRLQPTLRPSTPSARRSRGRSPQACVPAGEPYSLRGRP